MKSVLMIALLSLAGCATSNQTFGPDGKAAFTISCPGSMNSYGSCYEKAGALCNSAGYEVLAVNGSATPFGISSGYANQAGGSFLGTGGAMVSRSLLVQCKRPA